jgi:phosphomannomutase
MVRCTQEARMLAGFFSYSDERIRGIFKRDDIRGVYGPEFNVFLAEETGAAYAELLREEFGASTPRVAVGRDARQGSVDIMLAFCRGIARVGGCPLRLGLVSSEICYHAAGSRSDLDGAAIITASHNPAEYNGVKMVKRGAVPLSSDELAALREAVVKRARPELPETLDLGNEFAETMLRLAGLSDHVSFGLDEPLKVYVEAGNGVGAVAFRPIADALARSGQFEFVWGNAEPNGGFPVGVPNPLLDEFMDRLGRRVCAEGADLGVGFDGDADRAGFVDERGQGIACSQVLALLAPRLVAASSCERPVVMRNLCCSELLRAIFPSGSGTELVDTPVGHAKIKELMRSPEYRERVVFAGEHSGHYFYPRFHYVDSGNLTTLEMFKVVAEAKARGECLSGLLRAWRERYVWSGEINFSFPDVSAVAGALDSLHEAYRGTGERYGVRVEEGTGRWRVYQAKAGEPYVASVAKPQDLKFRFPADAAASAGWWFVVRPSGNEPKLRLNVEAWGEDAGAAMARHRDSMAEFLVAAGGTELAD